MLTRRHPLVMWLWWPGGLAFLSPMELWQLERVFLGRLPPTQHCAENRFRHNPHFVCEGGLLPCPGALTGRAVFQFGTHLMDYRAALKKCSLWMSSWHLLQLANISPKRAYTLLQSLDFWNFCLGDTTRLPGEQGLCLWTHRTIYICILLKTAARESSFQTAWI